MNKLSLMLAVLAGVSSGCRTIPKGESLTAQQIELIRADSEVFAAVVRPEVEPGAKVQVFSNGKAAFDSWPFGDPQYFRETAGGGQGFEPSGLFDHPDTTMMKLLRQSRSRILKVLGAEEKTVFSYPNCGGTLAIEMPRAAGSRPDSGPRPGCPPTNETVITVGTPVRGQPASLRRFNERSGLPADLSGELWTVIADNHYAGPRGQNWFQSAWVFRRNASTGKLLLVTKILVAWAE